MFVQERSPQIEMIRFSCYLFTRKGNIITYISIEKKDYTCDELTLVITSALQKNYPEITSILIGFVPEAFQVFEKYPDIKHPKGEMINSETSRYKLSNETKISNDDIAMFFRFGAFIYIQVLLVFQYLIRKMLFEND